MNYNKKIVLKDGREFYGQGFGRDRDAICELVFNTSMVGYQEIISDPSYTDQGFNDISDYRKLRHYG